MSLPSTAPRQPVAYEPRWPAVVAILATGGIYLALPERLTPGPNWGLLLVLVVLVIPTIGARRAGFLKVNFVLGVVICSIVTAALCWSLAFLIAGLPGKREAPAQLLQSAVAIWVSNVLIFASWYWRLDAGGPHRREVVEYHKEGAFLFPQMTMPDQRATWRPGFVDYLFLAFNASTAFSPTDAPVLSRWAKVMMMIQSLISLGAVIVLAARAINIL
ncbi:MAG: hypothetical protein WA324_00915 [Bryobacteraceae bacterium]